MSAWLQKMFAYHMAANSSLFVTLAVLDRQWHEPELHTVLRLINHAYVVARIFAAHLSGVQHQYRSTNTEETPSLEQLSTAVKSLDQWYLCYLDDLPPEKLSAAIPFSFTDGNKGYMTREEILTHVVLHGAYHRGEVGRILSLMCVTPPSDGFAIHLHQIEPYRRLQGGDP